LIRKKKEKLSVIIFYNINLLDYKRLIEDIMALESNLIEKHVLVMNMEETNPILIERFQKHCKIYCKYTTLFYIYTILG